MVYQKESKHQNKFVKEGVYPIVAIAASARGVLVGNMLIEAYNAIQSKITGNGINHKPDIYNLM